MFSQPSVWSYALLLERISKKVDFTSSLKNLISQINLPISLEFKKSNFICFGAHLLRYSPEYGHDKLYVES